MNIDKNYKHPSFGVIGISRVSGKAECFKAEGLDLGGFIQIRIKTADVDRNLSHYWVHGDELVVSVRMSFHQFSEMITNLNSGDGVPCTIEYITPDGVGEVEKYRPIPDVRSEFESELKANLDKALDEINRLKQNLVELQTKSRISKKDLDALVNPINGIEREIKSNIPFVEKSFNEAMDTKISEAKVETAAWLDHKLQALGLENVKLLKGTDE